MINKITLHYTAGNLIASNYDLAHYHYVIDSDGRHRNINNLTPIDNIDCYDGKYVAHCKGCNTGNIGNSISGYMNKDTIPDKSVFEDMFKLAAEQMFIFNIPLSEVKTHAERNPGRKFDFDYLPDYWGIGEINGVKTCGNFIRGKVNWYYKKLINLDK